MDNNKSKVLVLDDDPSITDLLTDLLRDDGYEVLACNSPKDVLFLARQFRPDLLLLDIMMPEIDGYDVCRYFKRDPELQFTRILVLSARTDHESRVKSFQAKADAFLPKPFEIEELRTLVRNLTESKTQYDRMIAGLREQTLLDRTGTCHNWRYMEKRIGEELKRLDRERQHFSILLLYLPYLRQMTVRYGYALGNNVVKEVGQLMRPALREFDLLGMRTEECFVIVLPDTNAAGAKAVSTRLKQIAAAPPSLSRRKLSFRLSVVTLEVPRGTKPDELFSRIDEELRKAKLRQ